MSKHDPLDDLRAMKPRQLRKLLEEHTGMTPFMAKHVADLFRQKRQAEQIPPYSLVMVWDPDDRIFVVTVPELPGCRTHGDTYEEAAAKAREAIASWVGAARHFGDPLPAPHVERYPRADDAGPRAAEVGTRPRRPRGVA